MSNFKFELNLPGLNELMKSGEMQNYLLNAGNVVAKSAGEGYEAEVHLADYVAISNVYPTTFKSRRDNLNNNTLVKAIGAAGLPMHK